jgi:hypothetical protein
MASQTPFVLGSRARRNISGLGGPRLTESKFTKNPDDENDRPWGRLCGRPHHGRNCGFGALPTWIFQRHREWAMADLKIRWGD